jgi:soluble lytic murein transglycosylase-like protein
MAADPPNAALGFLTVVGVLAGLLINASASDAGTPTPSQGAVPRSCAPYGVFLTEASQRFSMPEIWICAVLLAESGGRMQIVSPRGALGLMQIMPRTWVELSNRYGLGGNPLDPHDNILAGTAYLREMFDRFGPEGFVAAYNAGPTRYDEYLASGVPLPEETQNYVMKLQKLTGQGASERAVPLMKWQNAPLFVDERDGFWKVRFRNLTDQFAPATSARGQR